MKPFTSLFKKSQNLFKNQSLYTKQAFRFSVEQQNKNINKKSNQNINEIPDIKKFMQNQNQENEEIDFQSEISSPYIQSDITQGKKYIINTFGCQMNVNDSEIINGILQKEGFIWTDNQDDADIILFNTCAIRESAEHKIWTKLENLRIQRKKDNKNVITGVLGCMAERLKEKLIQKQKVVDLVAGPDAYRDLPRLLTEVSPEQYQINVQLSLDETYADINPIRLNQNSKQAFVSIMRGCNNMCSYCIVPFTRGRERSREVSSIVEEVTNLVEEQGIKEITLLGQNVNSYFYQQKDHLQTIEKIEQEDELQQEQGYDDFKSDHSNSRGFNELYKLRKGEGQRFADLLEILAIKFPEVRFRFTSPHPKDFPDKVLDAINKYPNLCKNIHMPAQSGSTAVLKSMRRNHTREAYIELVDHIRQKIPGVTLNSDFITGFCGESEQDFEDTLSLLEYVNYEQAFLFAYSMREKTHAHRRLVDDVPEPVKRARLNKMMDHYLNLQAKQTKTEIGKIHLVLIDGKGKKKEGQLKGRTDTNRICIIEDQPTQQKLSGQQYNLCEEQFFNKDNEQIWEQLVKLQQQQQEQNEIEFENLNIGDFVICRVTDVTQRSLFCSPIAKSSISQFAKLSQNKPFVCDKYFNQQI